MFEWTPVWLIIIFGNLAAFVFAARLSQTPPTSTQLRRAWVGISVLTIAVASAFLWDVVSPRQAAPPQVAQPPLVAPSP